MRVKRGAPACGFWARRTGRYVGAWTPGKSACYTRKVLAYAAAAFFSGFALFLLGFSLFMRRESRKFGDNQFTMKLLPPPPRKGCTPVEGRIRAYIAGVPGTLRSGAHAGRSLARRA
jgi:hypothetical protein